MKSRIFIFILLFLLIPFSGRAQFYAAGDNPSWTRWWQVESPHYRIIYPRGLDSLAMRYGSSLEKYYPVVGLSAGFMPGEYSRGKMPVVLHPFNANSNGSVAWAPKTMNLFTSPQAYSPEAMTWVDMLTIHEQRHYAQMQTGLSGAFRPFGWFLGEMFNGVVAGIWQTVSIMEGDAVVAETALSRSGRGRTSDFMNYYMIAFDNGDFRNWNRWRLGSQKYHTLDQYSAGYLMLGGSRFLYGNSLLTADMFHRQAKKMSFVSLKKALKETADVTPGQAFEEIADTLNKMWQKDIEEREPFIPQKQIVPTPKRYTEYEHLVFVGRQLFAIRKGKTSPAQLVKLDRNAKPRVVAPFSGHTGPLHYLSSLDRLYWSESVPSTRWSMKVNSAIRYYDFDMHKKFSLTRKGRLFNPCPSEDETMLCTVEYFNDGRTGLTVVRSDDGKRVVSTTAPDSLQIVEVAWIHDKAYCSAISESGFGIYSVSWVPEEKKFLDDWAALLHPQPVQISNFEVEHDLLHFACDLNGVNELYHLDLESGKLYQETSTRYGGNDFVHSPSGKMLFFSAKRYDGNLIVRTRLSQLMEKEVDFSKVHVYPMAEELSRQEQELIKATYDSTQNILRTDADSLFTQPKRYYKLPHLLRFHSWAPVYFNIDNLMAMSGEKLYDKVSLGTAALSQNDLGTATMHIGYSAHKDPYNRAAWRHSGHLTFKYSGWFPVLEATVDINDRSARTSDISVFYKADNNSYIGATYNSRAAGKPFISGKFSAYVPLNFSRGGWQTGLIPRVSYTVSNDVFNTGISIYSVDEDKIAHFNSKTPGKDVITHNITGSLRFYTLRNMAEAAVYPRWGFGAEFGVSSRLGLKDFYTPLAYGNVYTYLPGILPQQGLFLQVMGQTNISTGSLPSSSLNIAPRGFPAEAVSFILNHGDSSVKFSAQYAIPIFIGDVSFWNSFIYIRRMVITPHFDYTRFGEREGFFFGELMSAGGTLSFDLESLFWLKFPFELGVDFSYNFGGSYGAMSSFIGRNQRFYIGPVFSVSFK